MADDPFDSSGGGDRTVFRPNPGGRRPQAPRPSTPAGPPGGGYAPPPPPGGYGAPPPPPPGGYAAPPPGGYAAPPPQGYPPPPQGWGQPAPTPYPPPQQPGYPPLGEAPQQGWGPAAPQSPVPRDDWGVVRRGDPYSVQQPVQKPVLLQRDEMIVPHQNPISSTPMPTLQTRQAM